MSEKNINIKIEKDVAQGEYANIVLTVHSSSEFIFDFAKLLPGLQEANVHTRIIMTPAHTKMFLKSLEDAVKKYEDSFGDIKIDDSMKKSGNIGFSGNQ